MYVLLPDSIFSFTHSCALLFFYSVLLLISSPELLPLNCYLLVIETLWDEACYHHVLTKNIHTPVDCMCCLEQAHRTAIALLSFLFALQSFSENINCTFLGFRQSRLHSFINERLGVEALNLTKPLIRLCICHFIPSSYRLCKKNKFLFHFVLYPTLFVAKLELYRCLFLHVFINTIYQAV